MDVREIATELYGLRPDQFTAARNARSKDLTASGNRELAAKVRELVKPSAAAWAINSLSNESASARVEFVTLGDKLQAAQAHPDRATLTKLVGKRRKLVTSSTNAAIKLAAKHGVQLSSSARDELEQTFQAALADGDAAEAVFSGRLIHGLTSDGLDPVDLAGAVAGTPAGLRRPKPADQSQKKPASANAKNVAAADAAREAAKTAEVALASANERIAELETERRQLERDASDLQDQFRLLEERQADFDARAGTLRREQRSALDAAQRARRTAKSADARAR